jgi:hypothetical protein
MTASGGAAGAPPEHGPGSGAAGLACAATAFSTMSASRSAAMSCVRM